ncbi:MAG: hypothetical protein PVF63_09675, partial [Gammaproteobacteria bacterium]
GETVPHILAAVLQTEPDWSRLPQPLHPQITHVLERCLTKRPRNRLHSIADVRIELEAVMADPSGAATTLSEATVAAAPRSRWPLIGVGAAAALAAAVAGWFLRPMPESLAASVVRFTAPLPDDQSFSLDAVSMISTSRDGAKIAYVANNQLYQRILEDAEPRPVSGTLDPDSALGASQPAYSPDGEWLAYVDLRANAGPYQIRRVPTSGGAPVLLHEASGGSNFQYSLTWPTDDTIMFANAEGVVSIPANGGAVEVLVAGSNDERLYSPQLLPDGRSVLFTVVPGGPGSSGGYESAQVAVQSIGGDDRTIVWQGGGAARYMPTGHLVYAQGTALFAIAFDPVARAISGGPVPLLDGLRRSGGGLSDTGHFAISDTGTLVNIPGDPALAGGTEQIETTVVWVDSDGREELLPIRPDDYTHARVSPDGTKVALVVGASLGRSTPPAIWIYDSNTRNLSLMATDPQVADGPVWSGDSRRIYFRSPGENGLDILMIELESGEISHIASGTDDGFPFPLPWSLTPDEQTLVIVNAQSATDVDIATVDLNNNQLTRMLFGAGNQNEPSISPNGAWIAHSEISAAGGESEILIRPFPDVFRTVIPVGTGDSPVFSRDGTQLYFVTGDGISAAPVEYEPNLRVGEPVSVLESDQYMWQLFGRTWDPDPTGERFIVPRSPEVDDDDSNSAENFNRIDVVLNWFEELRERVPTP